jgi:hypothetical protein
VKFFVRLDLSTGAITRLLPQGRRTLLSRQET